MPQSLPEVLPVGDPASPVAVAAIDIIRQSTPPAEQLDGERLTLLLRRADYRLYALAEGGEPLAASVIYMPEAPARFVLLDYMAVREDARNRGLGAGLCRAVIDVVRRERPVADFLLLEVDDDREGDPQTQTLARRRIAFYRRLGARLLVNFDYLFPGSGGAPTPMRLMMVPLGERMQPSPDALAAAIEMIFMEVHGRPAEDHLTQRNTNAIPPVLRFQ